MSKLKSLILKRDQTLIFFNNFRFSERRQISNQLLDYV